MEAPFQMSLSASAITLDDVVELIPKLSSKKTPKAALLYNRIIRLLTHQALQFLVSMFNSIFSETLEIKDSIRNE